MPLSAKELYLQTKGITVFEEKVRIFLEKPIPFLPKNLSFRFK